jgi:hypothetical protein
VLPTEVPVTLAILSAREKVDVNIRLPDFLDASEQILVELPFDGGPRLSWQRVGPHVQYACQMTVRHMQLVLLFPIVK